MNNSNASFYNFINFKNTLCIVLFTLYACDTNKVFISSTDLNTIYNTEYKNSTETYIGELSKEQYETIRNEIEIALQTTIPPEKPILINYRRYAKNCISMNNNGEHYLKVLKNSKHMSSKISQENKIVDFFVLNKDVFFLNEIKMKKNFILDSGFFNKKVFTIKENCSGFFLLKTDGTFMKYYGEDYYSKVIQFLKETY